MSAGDLNIRKNKIYGNYRGKVVDTTDTDMQGKVKIRIYPFFKDIEVAQIPWATPAMPIFEGAGTGHGTIRIPRIDTWLWCFFEMGSIYQPVYFAEAQTATMGIPPDVQDSSIYAGVKSSLTKNGISFYTEDNGANACMIQVTHPKGTIITVDYDGDINIDATRDVIMTVARDLTATISGDATIAVTGDVDTTVSGDVTATITGNVTETVTGNVTETVTGNVTTTVTGAVSIQSSSTIDINGTANVTVQSSAVLALTGSSVVIG